MISIPEELSNSVSPLFQSSSMVNQSPARLSPSKKHSSPQSSLQTSPEDEFLLERKLQRGNLQKETFKEKTSFAVSVAVERESQKPIDEKLKVPQMKAIASVKPSNTFKTLSFAFKSSINEPVERKSSSLLIPEIKPRVTFEPSKIQFDSKMAMKFEHAKVIETKPEAVQENTKIPADSVLSKPQAQGAFSKQTNNFGKKEDDVGGLLKENKKPVFNLNLRKTGNASQEKVCLGFQKEKETAEKANLIRSKPEDPLVKKPLSITTFPLNKTQNPTEPSKQQISFVMGNQASNPTITSEKISETKPFLSKIPRPSFKFSFPSISKPQVSNETNEPSMKNTSKLKSDFERAACNKNFQQKQGAFNPFVDCSQKDPFLDLANLMSLISEKEGKSNMSQRQVIPEEESEKDQKSELNESVDIIPGRENSCLRVKNEEKKKIEIEASNHFLEETCKKECSQIFQNNIFFMNETRKSQRSLQQSQIQPVFFESFAIDLTNKEEKIDQVERIVPMEFENQSLKIKSLDGFSKNERKSAPLKEEEIAKRIKMEQENIQEEIFRLQLKRCNFNFEMKILEVNLGSLSKEISEALEAFRISLEDDLLMDNDESL